MWENFDSIFYGNVGKILKNIIKIGLRIEIVLILIGTAVMEVVAFANIFVEEDAFYILLMPLILIGAALSIGVLWLSTLWAYGFAEIIDTSIQNRREKEAPVRANILPVIAQQKEEEEENKAFWVCECGMKNAEHSAACKGCGKSRTGAVVRGNGGVYKKCACGAMIKSGEKCPLCGKMVY